MRRVPWIKKWMGGAGGSKMPLDFLLTAMTIENIFKPSLMPAKMILDQVLGGSSKTS
jgi:hypothetical protein